jgi:hypothetical protein
MPPGADPREMDRVRVGNVHALYAADRGQIDIVSCLLLSQYAEAEPKLDANLRGLWRGVEDALESQFPDARGRGLGPRVLRHHGTSLL